MNKKVFLDTNIVADILDFQRKNHKYSIQLIEKLIIENYEICISEDMITTLFYISKNKKETLEFFKNVILIDWNILNFDKRVLKESITLSLENNLDLEDVLQCLCAKFNKCDILITNDKKFYNCDLQITTVNKFVSDY